MTRHHPLVQGAIRNFVTYNPMFVFSALLLLGGAWLVNPPRVDGGRDRVMLFKLFGAVQLYELVLIGAAALLARRKGLERDVRFLSFLLVPFFMDISCTNALTAEQTGTWPAHVLAILGILAVVAGKAWIVTRLVGLELRPSAWVALLAGPLAVTAGPFLASFLAYHGFSTSERALASGGVLAGLVLLWGAARSHGPFDAFTLRALSPIVLAVTTWHALGTAWAHTGSLLYVLGPALIALGPVLPRLAWPHAAARDVWTPLLLPAAGALLCGLPGLEGPEPMVGASAWQLGLMGMALVHGLGFARHRSLPFLLGLLVACDLLACGGTLERSLARVGHGPAEPIALLALFGYGLARGAHPALVLPPLVVASIFVANLGLSRGPLDAVLGLDVLGAGLLAWTHLRHGRGLEGAAWRFIGCVMLWLPVTVIAVAGGAWKTEARMAAGGTLVALAVLAAVTRLRGYAIPALLLPAGAARLLAPTSAAGWGTLGIGSAFVAVGLGVLVSLKREALLAWLERGRDAAPPRPRPISVPAAAGAGAGGPTTSRSGVVLASVLGGLLVPVVLLAGPMTPSHGRTPELVAISVLKTLCTAQTLFREGDKDGDGALDYARDLRELADAGLIDESLARGEKHGYRFVLLAGDDPERWMAVATPVDHDVRLRCYAVNHTGAVAYSEQRIPLTRSCELPAGARRIGR